MSDDTKHIRSITKPRLIAALLAELDAAQAIILARDLDTGFVTHTSLNVDFQVPFDLTRMSFRGGVQQGRGHSCLSCFAGQRVEFETRMEDSGCMALPTEVRIVDLRHERRMSFARKMYSAEIITNNSAYYGYAADVNRDFLAIDLNSCEAFAVGDQVKVIIRLIDSNCDVYYRSCRVMQIKTTLDEARVILSVNGALDDVRVPRAFARHSVSNRSITLGGIPFFEFDDDITVPVRNISSGGMTVSAPSYLGEMPVVPGLLVHSKDMDVSFLVVWSNDENFGLKPVLPDPDHLNRWYHFVDSIVPISSNSSFATRTKVAEIITHSGLLKGKRRGIFGRSLADHIVSASKESALLMIRTIVISDDGEATAHFASRRVSERMWCLTDGAATDSNPKLFERAFRLCVETVSRSSKVSVHYPRYFCSVVHPSVKTTHIELNNLRKFKGHRLFSSFHISLAAAMKNVESREKMDIRALSPLSAPERCLIFSRMNPYLLDGFGGLDGLHPILNTELGKLGPHHRAETKVIFNDNRMIGVAHRLFTHTVWSTTGVTNSVFVILPKEIVEDELKLIVRAIGSDPISFGTDDLLFISEEDLGPSVQQGLEALAQSKAFEFHLHDMLENSLSFEEDDESIELRRKG